MLSEIARLKRRLPAEKLRVEWKWDASVNERWIWDWYQGCCTEVERLGLELA